MNTDDHDKVEQIAKRLRAEKSHRRQALGHMLAKIAGALTAIKWRESGEWGEAEENRALDAVLYPSELTHPSEQKPSVEP